jgi:pilus assembly protein FimV
MEKPKWRATALAFATAVLLGMSASDASALALGPVTVQSALGEPLRARIDIPEINAEELASLRVAIASPAAYRTAGLDYSAAISAITVKLESRPNGRPYLSVTSSRPVTEPFLDLLLETSWASGRIVRDYTMLFDPPALRQNTPPVAAQVSPAPRANAQPSAAPSTSAPAPAAAAAPNAAAPAPAAVAPKAAASSAAAERPVAVPKTPAGGAKQLTVQRGDTAGRIAAANKPANVSLDQMLVAMLRANPDAFIGGNVNRLKSGAVLDVPREEDAALVPSDEARQTLVAQSRDFNEFRRKLAEALPTTPTAEADRQTKGKVQAQVEEKKPAAATPDKLTLSKGAVQAKGGEDKIARDRAAQDAATRVAELNKNISELNKLGTATAPAASASSAKGGLALPVGPAAAIKPAASAPAPAVDPVVKAPALPAPAAVTPAPAAVAPAAAASAAPAVAAATMAVTPASSPANSAEAPAAAASAASADPAAQVIAASPAASAPTVTAPAAAASAARAKPLPAPAAPAEASLMDELLDNPMVPVAAGGILALLLGFGFYRVQQRKKSAQVDSSFLESRLQPDSFFGASGGQRVDTAEAAATGSSMVYSPSQLDAAGDVDPVAEADVYLAYGRDLQAEEILKEAMRTTPQRVAIHAKLLEIYAKRRDAKAFEVVAAEAYSLTRGEGPEWEHICGLGQELDASNPLYRPGGQPARAAGAAAASVAAAAPVATVAATQPVPLDAAAALADVDLDLDFSLGDDDRPAPVPAPVAAARPAAVEPVRPAPPPVAELMPSLDMDFQSTGEPVEQDAPELTLGNDSLSFTAEPAPAPAPAAAPRPAATPAVAPAADTGMIEFDLGALSLDLEPPAAAAPAAATAAAHTASGASADATGGDMSNDPLATKLALAQEFNAIGDPDGARSLAQEVLAEASGDLKSRAQRFLAEIS